MRDLTWTEIPEKDVAAFSQGVLSTLEELGYDYEFDETSPPNEKGEVTFMVKGVHLAR